MPAPKYTPELAAAYLDRLLNGGAKTDEDEPPILGLWKKDAAHMVGLGYQTIRDWECKGREGIAPYDDFLRREMEVESTLLTRVLKKAQACALAGNNAGARYFMWIAERRFPRDFAEVGPPNMRRTVEVESPDEDTKQDSATAENVYANLGEWAQAHTAEPDEGEEK